jgi:acylphosphatase
VSDGQDSGGGPVRRRVVVTGQVQGVFYRDSCRRAARSRGVAGWVRNLPDGDVEAVFEGAADAVDAMVAWARVGPPHASVSDLTAQDEKPEGLSGFTVH